MKRTKLLSKLRDPWVIFTLLCILISIVFIIFPIIQVFSSSLMDSSGKLSVKNYHDFFQQNTYIKACLNSLKITFICTLIASVIAITLAYLLSRFEIKNRNAVLTLITMATASPPFLGAYAWMILLGRYGTFNKIIKSITGLDVNFAIQGEKGIVWVITWLILPLIFLMTYDSFTNEDLSHKEAAMSLGANKLKAFFTIELPLAVPGIMTGMLMAALQAFSDFGTPAVIGGEYPLLPTLVYGQFVSEVGGSISTAATAGVIMIFISTLLLMAQRLIIAKREYSVVSIKHIAPAKPKKAVKVIIYLIIAIIMICSFLPHITLLVVSFLQWKWGVYTNTFTLSNYATLFTSQFSPILISFFLGIVATLLDFLIGIGIAYLIVKKHYKFVSNFVNILVMVPYIIPGTVLAVGYIVLFNKKPLVLTGTWIILVISYFIRKLPYAVKSAESSLYSVHNSLEEAALILGAKPIKAFKDITFRLILGGVVSGITLCFLQVMTELSSTIILYTPPWITMSVVIFQNSLSAGSDFGVSASMGVVLMICIYVPMYLVTRKTRKMKTM